MSLSSIPAEIVAHKILPHLNLQQMSILAETNKAFCQLVNSLLPQRACWKLHHRNEIDPTFSDQHAIFYVEHFPIRNMVYVLTRFIQRGCVQGVTGIVDRLTARPTALNGPQLKAIVESAFMYYYEPCFQQVRRLRVTPDNEGAWNDAFVRYLPLAMHKGAEETLLSLIYGRGVLLTHPHSHRTLCAAARMAAAFTTPPVLQAVMRCFNMDPDVFVMGHEEQLLLINCTRTAATRGAVDNLEWLLTTYADIDLQQTWITKAADLAIAGVLGLARGYTQAHTDCMELLHARTSAEVKDRCILKALAARAKVTCEYPLQVVASDDNT
eukprot:TRINITY_DN11517_c2_g1_i1.p1 TRINITY_DN11517_c2_g1~~TRINITY_DN11517_c2_g1_i1.p1  ORF type:complete len:325 (+),score=40.33 TRINITY_DN11517_c2_g1_i1:108-1082(+)